MTNNMPLHIRLFALIAFVFLSLGIVGCGASKTEKTDSSSRGTASPANPSQQKLAECNRVNAQRVAVEGHISTFYDPATGQIKFDFINMSLQTIPLEVATEDTYTIQFFRWSEKSAGRRQTNSIPTRFLVMDRLTGSYFIGNTVDRISKSLVDNIISSLGSNTSVTPQNVVQRAHFILTGVEFQYDGIAVALVDKNNSVVSSVDILLPPFYADPNIYASKINIPAMQYLHPFYNLRTSGGTESDFYRMSEEICTEMISASSRVPASIDGASPAPAESKFSLSNLWNRFLSWLKSF